MGNTLRASFINLTDCLDQPRYVVSVKTRDTKGAGLHNKVFITFIDKRGRHSEEILLDGCAFTVFKKGHTDDFKIYKDVEDLGHLEKIQILRREDGKTSKVHWFLEKIEVAQFGDDGFEGKAIFPCHRWIYNKRPVILSRYDCVLTQFDVEHRQRETELFWKRAAYKYKHRAPGIPPQIKDCPNEELFSHNYVWNISFKTDKLVNRYKLPSYGREKWRNFAEFDILFHQKLGVPMAKEHFDDDLYFAWQRIGGCNPGLIKLCREIPESFGVTSEMVEPFLEGITLEEALEGDRIYIVDLTILSEVDIKTDLIVVSPYALFYINNAQKLQPLAIQLFSNKRKDNPVFTPNDPKYTWMMAKMWFNNADAAYHRACANIGFTHLLLESVAIATNRQLSPSHPIFRLILGCIRYVIPINCFEVNQLLVPGGWVDNTTNIGSKGMYQLIKKRLETWRLDQEGYFPQDLKNRGVFSRENFPEYPYRDDGLMLHYAIENYLRRIVQSHYDSDEKVQDDSEIQAWAYELSRQGEAGCGINGIAGDRGRFSNAEELIKTLSSIFFLCLVGHAAVNIPQYDEYSFIPNYPAILFGNPPDNKRWREGTEVLDQLPPKDITLDIMVVTRLLSDRETQGLADFYTQYQLDPIATDARDKLTRDLRTIALTIMDKNKTRDYPYDVLNPGST